MKYIIFSFFLSCVVLGETRGQNILFDTTHVAAFIDGKKDSINGLIEKIDVRVKGSVGFYFSHSSLWIAGLNYNYLGLNYIYLVDLILSGDTLDQSNRQDSLIQKYQVGYYGVLVKGSSNTIVKYNDMILIKERLKKWWEKNKQLPFEEIQKKWNTEMPLRKLGYRFA